MLTTSCNIKKLWMFSHSACMMLIVYPCTDHEGPGGGGERYSSTLPSTSALDGVGGQRHAPAALPPRKTRYPLYRGLGVLRAGMEGCRKSRRHPDSIPGLSSLDRVAVPTEPSRPTVWRSYQTKIISVSLSNLLACTVMNACRICEIRTVIQFWQRSFFKGSKFYLNRIILKVTKRFVTEYFMVNISSKHFMNGTASIFFPRKWGFISDTKTSDTCAVI